MRKILVIDDDEAILEVVKFILEENNFEVHIRDNGDIEKVLRKFKPDLILLDVLLSGEDGRDIARKLKSKKDTKDIPLIMFSAHPSANLSAIKAGADDFIPKPFEIDHLLNVINNNLK